MSVPDLTEGFVVPLPAGKRDLPPRLPTSGRCPPEDYQTYPNDRRKIVFLLIIVRDSHPLSVSRIIAVVLTASALYAGTLLVTARTTAPSHHHHPLTRQNSSTLLATLCLALAVLTIANRCYASKGVTHPLAQLTPPPQPPTPTSTITQITQLTQAPPTSKLGYIKLLSGLFSDVWTINKFRKRRRRNVRNPGVFEVIKVSSHPNSLEEAAAAASSGLVENSVTNESSEWNRGNESSRVSEVNRRQNDRNSERLEKEEEKRIDGIERPMPPALDKSSNSLSNESTILVLIVSALVLTVALGLVTCVLSHYRGGTAADPHDAGQTPTTAPMLSVVSAGAAAGVGGMERLRGRAAARDLAASRDRQVRLHSVHTDIAINLPPSIALPDGEDHPFSSSRLHIRDSEQESEIYKCIKPPPNRTVLESESPPPYRSSSAGLLGSLGGSSTSSGGSSTSSCSDWSGASAPLVMRCHSMSSSTTSNSHKRPEAAAAAATAAPGAQKTDFIQRTVKIFTGKRSQPPPAPTLQPPPVVVVPTRQRQGAAAPAPPAPANCDSGRSGRPSV